MKTQVTHIYIYLMKTQLRFIHMKTLIKQNILNGSMFIVLLYRSIDMCCVLAFSYGFSVLDIKFVHVLVILFLQIDLFGQEVSVRHDVLHVTIVTVVLDTCLYSNLSFALSSLVLYNPHNQIIFLLLFYFGGVGGEGVYKNHTVGLSIFLYCY